MRALCVALAVVVDVADPVAKAMGSLKALEAKFHAESKQLHAEAAAMKRQVGNERAESFAETGGLTQGAVHATQAKLESLAAKIRADGDKFHADAGRPESTYVSAADKAESKAKFEKLFSHHKAPSSLLETEEQDTTTESVAEKRSKSFEERRAERKKQFEANEKKALEQLSAGKVPADPSADLKSAVNDAFASADDASSFAETGASSRRQERIQQLAQQLAADNDARFGAAPSSFLEAPRYPDYSKRDADEKAQFDDLHNAFEEDLKKDRKALQARFDGVAPSSLLETMLETMNPARAAELQKRLQQLAEKMKADQAAEDKLDASFLEVADPEELQKEDAELKALEAKITHDMAKWRQEKASFLEVQPGGISADDQAANALEDHELGQMEQKLKDLDQMGKQMRAEYAKEKEEFDSEKASSLLEAPRYPDYSKRDADEKAQFDDLHNTFEENLKKDRKALQARFDGVAPSSLAETGRRFSINDMSGPDFDEFRKAQAEAADADSQFVQAVKKFNVMDGQPGAVITAAEMAASSFVQTSDAKGKKKGDDVVLTPEEQETNAGLEKLEKEEDDYHKSRAADKAQELEEKVHRCKEDKALGLSVPSTCDDECNCHNPEKTTDVIDDTPVENDDTGDTQEIAPGDGVAPGDGLHVALLEVGSKEAGPRSDLFASMRALGAASESSLLQASETATAERARLGAGAHGKAAAHRSPGGLPFKSTAEAEAENARGWKTVQAEIDGLKKASGDYAAEMSALPPVHLRILPESFAETKAQRREIPVLDNTSPTTDAVLAQEDETLADLTREMNENSEKAQAQLKATFTHEALKAQNYQALSDDPSERVYAGTDLGASSYLEEGQQFRR